MLYPYRVVCASCRKEMGIKYTDDLKMKDKVSHSICGNCKDKLLKELNDERDIIRQRR